MRARSPVPPRPTPPALRVLVETVATRPTPALVLVALLALPVPPAQADGTYLVFPIPLRNPDDGDREAVVDPDLLGGEASPFGWHDVDGVPGADHLTTRGNNVHAYLDADGDDVADPDGSPSGGAGLDFSFPIDLGEAPAAYTDASVTNAFYWANVLHDVLYLAGFDEAAGNFQENGYGRGGLGGDAVRLEIQDGAFTNGANVFVDPDGMPPRMEVARFTLTTPHRDGALSSFLLAYLHGRAMSLRIVGGPATTDCLATTESAALSVGWGDWLALLTTARGSDAGDTPRTLGTYLFGQPLDGVGVRAHPYAADLDVNPLTYADLPTLDAPFGVGAVWATALWEVTWALIDAHGFAPDLRADPAAGGNVLALHLVVDAMKRLPCGPGFVDARDALLAADEALTGGENCARIWAAMATRGLGVGASQGSPSSLTDGMASFEVPGEGPCAVVGVTAAGDAPRVRLLAPNPFRGQATVWLTTDTGTDAEVTLFDVVGRRLEVLHHAPLPAGTHRWTWTPPAAGGTVSPVFLRVRVGDRVLTRTLVPIP